MYLRASLSDFIYVLMIMSYVIVLCLCLNLYV